MKKNGMVNERKKKMKERLQVKRGSRTFLESDF